jgi:hypothetical protein
VKPNVALYSNLKSGISFNRCISRHRSRTPPGRDLAARRSSEHAGVFTTKLGDAHIAHVERSRFYRGIAEDQQTTGFAVGNGPLPSAPSVHCRTLCASSCRLLDWCFSRGLIEGSVRDRIRHVFESPRHLRKATWRSTLRWNHQPGIKIYRPSPTVMGNK